MASYHKTARTVSGDFAFNKEKKARVKKSSEFKRSMQHNWV